MRDLLISHLNNMPLIGILRGVTPDEAVDTVGALYAAGFRMVEVPLNSPQPLPASRKSPQYADQMLIGAGTVLTTQQVADVRSAGDSSSYPPTPTQTLFKPVSSRTWSVFQVSRHRAGLFRDCSRSSWH
ncbi:MAG: hypothetical protein CM15mP120_15750 [Pseudomonadota bacterium]|nr:MAG: hypothetical protein CM15mP120_15750 [Pseudomonadota bacterium]